MGRRAKYVVLLGLMCLGLGLCWWRLGRLRTHEQVDAATVNPVVAGRTVVSTTSSSKPTLDPSALAANTSSRNRLKYRLSNTSATLDQLLRKNHALLLENALIDSDLPVNLAIPESLRAKPADEARGSYLVQARGLVDARFRALLQGAGAEVISYIPNNAQLVRASSATAKQLAGSPLVQTVLPYEPYYTLDWTLLKVAVEGKQLPPDLGLNLTVFPDARASTISSLQQLGATVTAEERTPFGTLLHVQPAAGTFLPVATLPGVMRVEPAWEREFANDLTRVRLGVSTNASNAGTYLDLSGTNIVVAINDSGVDGTHPDFTGRVTGALTDDNGHGTHVTGIILGSGAQSSTVTNAKGSVIPGADFRGMAPGAQGVVTAIGFNTRPRAGAGSPGSDAALQEAAALTNALVDNNSWNYGAPSYNIAAASYDAAVRDALPGVPGSQPLLLVFSAGNSGAGTDQGVGGNEDSIRSPATAKNVITVGAIEEARNITNQVVFNNTTNRTFQGETDSSNQVARFSSRGNVGVGIEGPTGRFKPDLVAPGTFILSDKSSTWNTTNYYDPTNVTVNLFPNFTMEANTVAGLPPPLFIPSNAVAVQVRLLANRLSSGPLPDLPIYAQYDDVPTTNQFDVAGTNEISLPEDGTLNPGSQLFFLTVNPSSQLLHFDVQVSVTTTNDDGNLLTVLSNLNDSLGPYYRYESGTSMSAASVSGLLALMQEFFTQRLGLTNNSPALMKALLINGARSAGPQYDFNVATIRNFQGWGLPALSNSIPAVLTNGVGSVNEPLAFFDQDPAGALATGQSHTRTIALNTNAAAQPLRITLVWTDPPGNPAAGVKLVNDLDLIVTNLDSGDVFYGNDIPPFSLINQPWDTNSPPPSDVVNNVENVYLPDGIGTNFSVTVYARRVNVNAVTANTNDVVQDYALVISSGDNGDLTNNFSVTDTPTVFGTNLPVLTTISNGLPLLGQRVGANSQFVIGTTNGVSNQWNFYVFTNSITTNNFTNVAFVTFAPPNLGLPRMGARVEDDPAHAARVEADVDMYVSTSSSLTNLDPAAFAVASSSLSRTGTEKVLFTNSFQGEIYYVAIRSQDQQGAEYALVGAATDQPFDQRDNHGNIILTVISPAFPAAIPPGTPSVPGAVSVLALTSAQEKARKVVVTDTITHQQFGDLVGGFSHGDKRVVLNNHSFFTNLLDVTETFTYDDTQEGDFPGSRPSDGPGSLRDFTGDKASDGIWIFSMVNDSSPSDLGSLDAFSALIVPQQDSNTFSANIPANTWFYDFVDVPENATNLAITVQITGANSLPMQLFVRRGNFPDENHYDKFKLINPPGGVLNLSIYDSPPLNPGRYFFGIFNPNAVSVQVTGFVTLSFALTPAQPFKTVSVGGEPLLDDAVTYSTNHVSAASRVVSAEVGIRIEHPRISDLVLALVSPLGTRVVLMENRGGLDTNGLGAGTITTNFVPPASSGTNGVGVTNTIAAGQFSGTVQISYNMENVPDDLRVYYDGVRIFDTGYISGQGQISVDFGPGASTDVVVVMNEGGNPNNNTVWSYQAAIVTKQNFYANFTDNTNKTTLPIKFAPPPFGTNLAATPSTVVFTNGFEGALPASYAGPGTNLVDGWGIGDTNQVIVVKVPAFADSGTNVLALHHGSIFRTLPTIAGHSYTLKFAHHGRPNLVPVSWWKAENNFFDSAPGNNNGSPFGGVTFAPGEVNQTFAFSYGRVSVGNPANLRLQNFTIDAWIKRNDPVRVEGTNALHLFDGAVICGYGSHGYALGIFDDGRLIYTQVDDGGFLGNKPFNDTNTFHHAAVTKNGNVATLYTDGEPFVGPAPEVFTFATEIAVGNRGDNARGSFLGEVDEADVFSTPLTTAQIQDIYAAGSAGKCPIGGCTVTGNLNLDGENHPLIGNDFWRTNVFTFIAPTNGTLITLQSIDDGMLFDSFQLFENPPASPANYYLPEESLSKLIGENSEGDWKLEVWDNRVGPSNAAPILVSWQLSLVLDRLVPATIPLAHGITNTNTVAANGYAFYQVDVPPWARFATNKLVVTGGGPVQVLFNQVQLPTNIDFVLINPTAVGGTNTLATNGPPPLLQPGNRYYLAVYNPNPAPANFTLEVDFDITPLTNLIALTNTLPATTLPRYFSYDVTSNAWAVAFELLNLSGNVNLYARKGTPLPDEVSYDYKSDRLGTTNELIVVSSNTTPVALSPGRWFLGVFNKDTNAVTYAIRATEVGPPVIIDLTNGVPLNFSSGPGPALTNFFRFVIDQTNAAALFELYALSGDVDLTLDRNTLPFAPPFFAASSKPGTNAEQIVIRTNLLGTNINANWFLGVPNNTTNVVTYTIRAVVSTNGVLISGQPSAPTVTFPANPAIDGVTLSWPTVAGELYEVQVSSDLITWVTVAIIQGTGGVVTYTDPTPMAGQASRFYRIVQIPVPSP